MALPLPAHDDGQLAVLAFACRRTLPPPVLLGFFGAWREERIANLLARFLVLAPALFKPAVNLPKSKIPRENEG